MTPSNGALMRSFTLVVTLALALSSVVIASMRTWEAEANHLEAKSRTIQYEREKAEWERQVEEATRRQEEATRRQEEVVSRSSAPARAEAPTGGDIAARIRQCESGNRNVANPRSSASGYYQFLDGTWSSVTGLSPPAMAHGFDVQHRAFLRLWGGGAGAGHWAASRSCWG